MTAILAPTRRRRSTNRHPLVQRSCGDKGVVKRALTLVRARQWLYKNKLVIVHERAIRTLIAAALAQLEVETGTEVAPENWSS